MCFTPDARGTEYYNSVPAGIEFQNDHECEARGIISVWARVRSTGVPNIIHHEGRSEGVKLIKTSGIDPLKNYDIFDNF